LVLVRAADTVYFRFGELKTARKRNGRGLYAGLLHRATSHLEQNAD